MGKNYYVTGTNYFVGGVLGRNWGAVSNCYAGGSVTGDWYVGGLVGDSSGGTISNCCATGTVTGYDAVGGLMGDNYYGTVSNCYAIGSVTGNWQVGGFAGHNNGTISASFWDTETSGQVNGVGLGSASGVTGKPTEEMQMESTFTSAGWDFSTPIWKMNCEGMSYPKLSWWQPVLGDFLCPDGVNFADYAVLAEQWLLEELSWDVGTDGGDGFVNFSDWAVFANGWYDTTDINDMADFVEQWVQYGVYCADIAPNEGNGVVDMFDLAVLVENWLVELW